MTQRFERLNLLRQIIIEESPCGQDEVRLALAQKGFYVSQSQLSRDMTRIHAYKVEGHYLIVDDLRYKRLP